MISVKAESGSLEILITQLADEFVARLERGESPDIEEYVARWPGDARVVRQVLASLQAVRLSSAGLAQRGLDESDAETVDATGRLGDFQLLREIGRGGMGVVYEAEQISLRRRIALKILPFVGVLDPRQLQRFKNEALAAGQLNHPNIVDVIAVGCERGVHYYAMRLIDGVTLAEVIAALKRLGLSKSDEGSGRRHEVGPGDAEGDGAKSADAVEALQTDQPDAGPRAYRSRHAPRGADHHAKRDAYGTRDVLEPAPHPESTAPIAHLSTDRPGEYYRSVTRLLADVAEALDYAHQSGVIHRDVKPSNLLLDSRGKLWVTDFGLAHVEANTEMTMTGDVLGTLRYMSPEQASGNRRLLDHRTDVYSLGATLYELLTLCPAFNGQNRQQLLRQIAEAEPLAPRKIARSVPVDLETIALKALEKEPSQRYATAGALAGDLRRYLDGKAIQARALSRRQRIVRWTRRHVGLVYSMMAALAIALSVSVGAGVVVYRSNQAKDEALVVANEQRQQADERLAIAEQAVDDYLNRITEDPDLKRSDFNVLRKKLLESAVPFFQRLAEQQPGDSAAEAERGRAYQRLAFLRQQIGEKEEALADWNHARSIFARLSANFHTVPAYREELAVSQRNAGNLLVRLGRHDEAESDCRAALAIQEQLAANFPNVPHYRSDLSTINSTLAVILAELGRQDEGESACRTALAIRHKLADEFPDVPEYRRQLAASHHNLGNLLNRKGHHDEAGVACRAALSIRRALVADFPNVREYRLALTGSQNNLGNLLAELGAHVEAESAYRAALAIQEKLAADFPTVPEYRETVARSHLNIGLLLADVGRYDEAEAAFRAYLAIEQKLAADFPQVPGYVQGIAICQNHLGLLLASLGNRCGAESAFRDSLTIQQNLTADYPQVAQFRLELATTNNNLGGLLRQRGEFDRSEAAFRIAISIKEGLVADFPTEARYRAELATSQNDMSLLLNNLGKYDEAEAACRAALAVREKLAANSPNIPKYRHELGRTQYNLSNLLAKVGRADEAEAAFRRSIIGLEKLVVEFPNVPGYAVDLGASYSGFANFLCEGDHVDDALEWYRMAIQVTGLVLSKDKRLVKARRLSRNSHTGRAVALHKLKRRADAISD